MQSSLFQSRSTTPSYRGWRTPRFLPAFGVALRVADACAIDQRALLVRTTRKYLLDRHELPSVLAFAASYYDIAVRDELATPRYYTQYYDTPDRRYFWDHVAGNKPRQKIRIRSYENSPQSFLEIKTQQADDHCIKHRLGGVRSVQDRFTIADREFLAEHARVAPNTLCPSLVTAFRRLTLVARATLERVTIDIDLSATGGGKRATFDDRVVIEVKVPTVNTRSRLSTYLASTPEVHPTSFSKYCNGMRAVDSSLDQQRCLARTAAAY